MPAEVIRVTVPLDEATHSFVMDRLNKEGDRFVSSAIGFYAFVDTQQSEGGQLLIRKFDVNGVPDVFPVLNI